MLPLLIQLKNYLGWQSRGKLQLVLKEKSVLKGRGINTKGDIHLPSKSFSIFFKHKNISFGLKVLKQITFSFFPMIYSLSFLPLTALRPSNTSNIFLQLVAYKVSLKYNLLCVLLSTCSINFGVARSRRYFYSSQHENLLSRQKVIRATNVFHLTT